VVLGASAIEDYQRDVKPHLDLDAAARELAQLTTSIGQIGTDPPPWVTNSHNRPYFLEVGGMFVLPITRDATHGWLATACLVAGQIRPIDRQKRAQATAQRKSAKRARRNTPRR
jgi:hypothetical protein